MRGYMLLRYKILKMLASLDSMQIDAEKLDKLEEAILGHKPGAAETITELKKRLEEMLNELDDFILAAAGRQNA